MATRTEIERLSVVETKIDSVQEDVAEVKTALQGLSDKLDSRFAAKWVEKVVAGFVGILLTVIVVAVVSTVTSQPTQVATITRTTTSIVRDNGTTTTEVKDSTGATSSKTNASTPGAQPGTTVTVEQLPAQQQQPAAGQTNGQASGTSQDQNNGIVNKIPILNRIF